jgi:hypothetical protein
MPRPVTTAVAIRERRRDASGAPPRREAGATAAVLALQQGAGNRAVSRLLGGTGSARRLQREIKVSEVDFDPKDGLFRHGYVNEDTFYPGLSTALSQDGAFSGHKPKLAAVLGVVRAKSYDERDIHTVTEKITTDVVNEFSTQGRPIAGALADKLRKHVLDALVANIRADYKMRMDPAELAGFDLLKTIAGDQMSRRKERASQVDYGRLQPEVKDGIAAFVQRVNAENLRWTLNGLPIDFVLPATQVSGPLIDRLAREGRYQGNHANKAKWLPTVAAPADTLDSYRSDVFDAVYAAASAGLKTRMLKPDARRRLGLDRAAGALNHNPHRAEFTRLVTAELHNSTDAALRRRVWATLAQGVTGYVEFSLPSDAVSRLVYNVVDDSIYVSVHYKWRYGYTPWFQVQNAPALVF